MKDKHERNELIIERAANGFIVTLPPNTLSDTERAMEKVGEVMTNYVKSMSDEADPLLAELQGKEKMPEIKMPKDELEEAENIYVFSTFEAVLDFLAMRFDYLMPG